MIETFEMKDKRFKGKHEDLRFFAVQDGDVYLSSKYLNGSQFFSLMFDGCHYVRIDGLNSLYFKAKDISEVKNDAEYLQIEQMLLRSVDRIDNDN